MSRQSNSTTDFLSRTPRKGSPREKALRACITDERLATYNYEAQRRSCPALELYLWDHDMASACMGDIAILEVALRNRMDRQLSLLALEQNGTEDWYMAGLQFDDRTQYQIREAWNHLTPHQRKNHTHGHLIASLTFGFWRNLLEDGGTIHTLDIVKTVHALRNRVAHHEPLVNGIPLPGENRRIALENATQACFALAMILDRDLHAWLMDNSKMKLVLEHELKPNE